MRPTVPEVMPLVLEYVKKPGNGAGGSLHVVLADNNVTDDNVKFCRRWALERGDVEGWLLAGHLLLMSKTQRSKIAGTWPEALRKSEAP